jgi:hypothetical protein
MAVEELDKLNAMWQKRFPGLAKLQFCNWVVWKQRATIGHANERGVYILARYDEREEVPHSVDPFDEFIIYIGATPTRSLEKRLGEFHATAFRGSASHAGGATYRELFGTSQQGLHISACPVYLASQIQFDVLALGEDYAEFIVSMVTSLLEVCLRGLYIFKQGRLPACNKE